MMRIYRFWFAVLVGLCICSNVLGAGLPGAIYVRANPETIMANGISTSSITVEVQEASGHPVDDGTEVRFSTTLGAIPAVAKTRDGEALALLKSKNIAGIAIVTATAGGVSDSAEVEFTSELGATYRGNRNIIVEAEHLAYSTDKRVIIGTSKVKVRYRGITLLADLVEIDLIGDVLRAEKGVKISGGEVVLDGDRVSLDLRSLTGVLLAIRETVERIFFVGEDLHRRESVGYEPVFNVFNYEDTQTWVIGKRMEVFPREKIHVRHAEVWFNDVRIIRLPYYVIPLDRYQSSYRQQIGFSATEGFLMDLPFYYSVSENTTGALRLRNRGGSEWGPLGGMAPSGWCVDLEQQYSLGERQEGVLTFEQVTGRDWGLKWRHQQELSPSMRGYLYLDYPKHRNLYGTLNLYKEFSDHDIYLTAFGNKLRGQPMGWSSRVWWRLHSRQLGNSDVSYHVGANYGLSRSPWHNGLWAEKGFQGSLVPADWYLDSHTTLSAALDYQYFRDSRGIKSNGPEASLHLRRTLGKDLTVTLGYSHDYSRRWVGGESARRTMSLSLYGGSGYRWFGYGYVTHDLDEHSWSVYGDFSWQLSPAWRVDIRPMYQKFSGIKYNDTELYLVRCIGAQEVMLCWSPSRHQLWVELAGSRF